jgi:4,5-DOPA dioxygenase extradiol
MDTMTNTKMPAIFFAHGSPMNIIADNDYSWQMQKLSLALKKPEVVLMISAHWSEYAFTASSIERPPLIYDFYGFPDELYAQAYSAVGSPNMASLLQKELGVNLDGRRGLDHGAWAVLKKLFPKADVPVVQVSLNRQASLYEHYEFGKKLSKYREKGALILGSGNLTHNLREAKHDGASAEAWALECERDILDKIVRGDIDALLDPVDVVVSFQRAHPTIEHYVPAIVALGAMCDGENITKLHCEMQNGSISMSSFGVGI